MDRRDFLKLLTYLPGLAIPAQVTLSKQDHDSKKNANRPNILILVFDALAAQHMSVYGYQRETTPNLARFAEQSTVYHRHHSTGSFTNPGTASLLTGTYPWTHRSINLYSPTLPWLSDNNLFTSFPGHKIYAYSHNLVAYTLLDQFVSNAKDLIPLQELCLYDQHLSDSLFKRDHNIAAHRERLFQGSNYKPTTPSSILVSWLSTQLWNKNKARIDQLYHQEFPSGVPFLHEQIYIMEHAIDWLIANLVSTYDDPYLGYFHFGPPHGPYNPRSEFVGMFDNDWHPIPKPVTVFSDHLPDDQVDASRLEYNEFIAYADAEFGRLLDAMSTKGVLDNTYIIVTADHGEMFERGLIGHINPTLYDTLVRIPLLIHAPGQSERVDIDTTTSSVDVMPTLLHAVGQSIPDWCEGNILPGFGDEGRASDSSVFAIDSKTLPKTGPAKQATMTLVRQAMKLIHYHNYAECPDSYELYNLDDDPDEMVDLYHENDSAVGSMKEELLDQLYNIG